MIIKKLFLLCGILFFVVPAGLSMERAHERWTLEIKLANGVEFDGVLATVYPRADMRHCQASITSLRFNNKCARLTFSSTCPGEPALIMLAFNKNDVFKVPCLNVVQVGSGSITLTHMNGVLGVWRKLALINKTKRDLKVRVSNALTSQKTYYIGPTPQKLPVSNQFIINVFIPMMNSNFCEEEFLGIRVWSDFERSPNDHNNLAMNGFTAKFFYPLPSDCSCISITENNGAISIN